MLLDCTTPSYRIPQYLLFYPVRFLCCSNTAGLAVAPNKIHGKPTYQPYRTRLQDLDQLTVAVRMSGERVLLALSATLHWPFIWAHLRWGAQTPSCQNLGFNDEDPCKDWVLIRMKDSSISTILIIVTIAFDTDTNRVRDQAHGPFPRLLPCLERRHALGSHAFGGANESRREKGGQDDCGDLSL